MKKILLLLVLSWISFSLSAQIGTTIGIQAMETSTWNRMLRGGYDLPDVNMFKPTIYLGIDYQLPFPKKGIKIIPELSYSQYRVSVEYEFVFDPANGLSATREDFYVSSFYSFSLNLDFHLLNFSTSTTIPAYSKNTHWFKDGFFFRVSPTHNYIRYRNHNRNFDPLSSITNGFTTYTWHNFSVRVATGVDFGVNETLTVSPIISYTFLNELNWNDMGIPSLRRDYSKNYPKDRFLSDAHHFQFGMRLSYKFNKKNIFTGRHI